MKIRIDYNIDCFSKEEVHYNIPDNIKIQGFDSPFREPQNNAFTTICLLIIENSKDIITGIIKEQVIKYISNLISIGIKKYKNKPVKTIDSTGKLTLLSPSVTILGKDSQKVTIILENNPILTNEKLNKIVRTINYLKKDNYFIMWEDSSNEFTIYNELDYARKCYDRKHTSCK